MRRLLAIAFLMFMLGSLVSPAYAGVTAGGRPYLPGGDLPVGGVTAGGRPFITTGGVFTPTGFGLGAQFYDEEWDDPYWGGGGWADWGWWPSWSWFGWGAFGVLDLIFGLPVGFLLTLY